MPTSHQGIDFSEALAILSSRCTGKEESKAEASCPCHAQRGSAGNFGNMGQIINLEGTASDGSISRTAETTSRSKQEFLDNVLKMSTRQLLQTVLEAQQQRVATYREYDRGLEAILATKNVGYYPTVCSEATAAFSVVSDTLQALQDALKGRQGGGEYLALIQQLQTHEQAKLQYTAAYHLELIRLNQTNEDNVATRRLLQESTTSLQSKLTSCVDSINEALDEIQCALLDALTDDGKSE